MKFSSNPKGEQREHKKLLDLEQIPEADDNDIDVDLKDKPKYFDEYDDVFIDSEDELVAGENNYIEIDCFPLNPPPAA